MLASLGQNHATKHAGSFTAWTDSIALKCFLAQLNLLLQTWPERAAAPGRHGWAWPAHCDKQCNMFTNFGLLEGPQGTIPLGIPEKRWLIRNEIVTDRMPSLSGLFLLAETRQNSGKLLFCFKLPFNRWMLYLDMGCLNYFLSPPLLISTQYESLKSLKVLG